MSQRGSRGVITGIQVPLEAAMAMCGVFLLIGAGLAHWVAQSRRAPHSDPLADLMQPDRLGPAIDLAARRNAKRDASHAVLRGRIDQLAATQSGLDADMRAALRDQIAAVMRSGLRRGDTMTLFEGDGFTIIAPGADESGAVRMADRLRDALATIRLSQSGAHGGLKARFGVAAGDAGEPLAQRALRALEAAMAQNDAHVVSAADIREVIYLPAPAPSAIAAAA
jgi:GGDEF domain-containing protein